jgi:hypothetical protein
VQKLEHPNWACKHNSTTTLFALTYILYILVSCADLYLVLCSACTPTMLALLAWCGPSVKSIELDGKRNIQAFSSLGGNFLGILCFAKPTTSNIVEAIKDLQRQASLLLRHERRTPNYMQLVVDNTKLPTLKYSNDMTDVEKQQVLACLQHTTSKSSIKLSWDEDDSQALDVLNQHHTVVLGQLGSLQLSFMSSFMAPELGVLTFLPNIRNVFIGDYRYDRTHALDLGFLSGMPDLQKLDLSCVWITSWDFAKNLDLVSLTLFACKIETQNFEHVRHLVAMTVSGGTNLTPSMLSTCTNLKTLSLRGFAKDRADAFRALPGVGVLEHNLAGFLVLEHDR